WKRPGRVVYNYDWNRPDPRYGRYYRPDRYYRSGYEPIRVDRSTRIYRGYDDRYYCRRSDGTTGLIVGAALGGLLGGQLDRGYSNTAGVLIGAGAGALLGREIDRGGVSCR
ncbi:MAG TPA: glycine zipper 2TM domain-containing protein, partial [Sphingobium sp.]|nr:glycine zipper 2TM domain-containing protein [Sphingobium sp.]